MNYTEEKSFICLLAKPTLFSYYEQSIDSFHGSQFNLPQEMTMTLKINNENITNPTVIANIFNNYFVDVIESNVDTSAISTNNYNETMKNLTSQSLFMQHLLT